LFNSDFIDALVAGAGQNLQMVAKRSRLLFLALQREVARLEGERGELFYLVHVSVPDEQLERLGDHRLQPGMPADVMIKTGDRTALQYLFQPLLDSLDHAWRDE
jgi:multidrug efflux pump subunit AcrA (membrane-fusion protein)